MAFREMTNEEKLMYLQESIWNPGAQGDAIREEVCRYMEEGPRSIEELCEGLDEATPIVYITNRMGEMFFALVGSPLYIALHEKQYDEAEKILDTLPKAACPGYAALPAAISRNREKDKDDPNYFSVEFKAENGIYLEELVFTDPEIPDGLFRKLWDQIWERETLDRSGMLDEDLFQELSGTKVPNFIRDWPSRIALSVAGGDINLFEMSLDGNYKTEPHQALRKAAVEDLNFFFRAVKGLLRMKELDEQAFRERMDGRMKAHLLLGVGSILSALVQGEFGTIQEDSESVQEDSGSEQSIMKQQTEMLLPKIKDWDRISKNLKAAFQKLDLTDCTADHLWDAGMDYERNPREYTKGFWPAFYLWKKLLGRSLVLTADAVDGWRAEMVIGTLLNLESDTWEMKRDGIRGTVCPEDYMIRSVTDAKSWIDLIDGVKWENYARCHSVELMDDLQGMMDVILDEGDSELLRLCLLKNLFPEELFEVFSRKAAEWMPECLSMFVLKKHMGSFCPV